MEQTYLHQTFPANTIYGKVSYLNNYSSSTEVVNYRQLPEEYDVFSNIRSELTKITEDKSKQKKLINSFCDSLQKYLFKNIDSNGIKTVLPKFTIEKDPDDAYIFNLIKNNYRIFINFEKEINNSFYGIILQQISEGYVSTTGKINNDNYVALIEKLSQIILTN